MNIHRYITLPSTNTLAKEMILEGKREGVIIADRQTAGRGRLGRSFFSENGLFMSVILSPEKILIPPALLTSATAAAVCRVLRKKELDIGIKWVNDLYFEGKKSCGILTEAVSNGSEILGYVVGIGINLSKNEFPEELSEIATALPLPLSCREKLMHEIVSEMENARSEEPSSLIAYLKAHSIVLGRSIRFFGAKEGAGIALDLDAEGGLIVQTEDGGRITLNTGEISVKMKNL